MNKIKNPNERLKKIMGDMGKITQLIENAKISLAPIEDTPSFIKNGEMRDYQIIGVNWLLTLHENNLHGILADDMGLGKTLQTICFLGYLKHVKKLTKTHMILVPLSTVNNWAAEIEKWCPSLSYYIHKSDKIKPNKRLDILRDVFNNQHYDVIITSNEVYKSDKGLFNNYRRDFGYLIIDEGHCIKNCESELFKYLKHVKAEHRLILTGTPIQNNLIELWSLLNFLLPDRFNSMKDFDEWFSVRECLSNDEITQNLQNIIKPLVLQRLKASVAPNLLPKIILDVYVPLSSMQRNIYRKALVQELAELRAGALTNSKMQNLLAQLRKSCLHPYLFDGMEDGPPYTTDEQLLVNSGKMFFLDKMLSALYEKKSRVLLFSQMTRILNIIEDYCIWRKYKYLRLDGNTDVKERSAGMKEFNAVGSDIFIYLISTRAGGLGINLQTADTVIFYDIDWNPQVDFQAMDRAHRIGQHKQVYVYRLITENTLEEKMLERSNLKKLLNERILKKRKKLPESLDSLLSVLRYCAEYQIYCIDDTDLNSLDIDIEKLLKEGHPKKVHIVDNNNKENEINYNKSSAIKRSNQLKSREWYKKRENNDFRFYPRELSELIERRNSKRTKVLTDKESSRLNELLRESFQNWTASDFRSFLFALETFGVSNMQRVYTNVCGKTPQEVEAYSKVFWERLHELQDHEEIISKIPNVEKILTKKEQYHEEIISKIPNVEKILKKKEQDHGEIISKIPNLEKILMNRELKNLNIY